MVALGEQGQDPMKGNLISEAADLLNYRHPCPAPVVHQNCATGTRAEKETVKERRHREEAREAYFSIQIKRRQQKIAGIHARCLILHKLSMEKS